MWACFRVTLLIVQTKSGGLVNCSAISYAPGHGRQEHAPVRGCRVLEAQDPVDRLNHLQAPCTSLGIHIHTASGLHRSPHRQVTTCQNAICPAHLEVVLVGFDKEVGFFEGQNQVVQVALSQHLWAVLGSKVACEGRICCACRPPHMVVDHDRAQIHSQDLANLASAHEQCTSFI